MRMKRDEKCIIPGCDEGSFSGGKPIYIRLTVAGKRTLKKVGALCKRHLPEGDVDEWLRSGVGSAKDIMSWLVHTPADDINFKTNLERASLPLLRRALERLEDELRRGLPHKTRIKKVDARIRALEKDLLKEDARRERLRAYKEASGSVVDQVLPQKKQLSVGDGALIGHSEEDTVYPKNGPSMAKWREVSELGKKILPGTEKVHCGACDCDNVPDKDGDGSVFCSACGALIKLVEYLGEEP